MFTLSESTKTKLKAWDLSIMELHRKLFAMKNMKSEDGFKTIDKLISYMDTIDSELCQYRHNPNERNTAFDRLEMLKDLTAFEWCARNGRVCLNFFITKVDGVEKTLKELVHDNSYSYDHKTGLWTFTPTHSLGPNYEHGVDILDYSTNPRNYMDFKYTSCDVNKFMTREEFEGNVVNGVSKGSGNSIFPIMFLGVELEAVVRPNHAISQTAREVIQVDLGREFAILKSDSSVGGGFEIVTAPATLAYHRTAWDKFFENSANKLKSYSTSCCGMHVHMSRDAFTPLHLGKLVTFYNATANRDFIVKIAGRNSNQYASFDADQEIVKKLTGRVAKQPRKEQALTVSSLNYSSLNRVDKLMKPGSPTTRGSAVNLQKGPTVEIRIFKGNVSKVGFMKNLEFVHAVYEFTKLASYRPVSLTKESIKPESYGLTVDDFIRWLTDNSSPDYNNLKLWLASSSYMKHRKLEMKKEKKYQKFNVKKEDVLKCA